MMEVSEPLRRAQTPTRAPSPLEIRSEAEKFAYSSPSSGPSRRSTIHGDQRLPSLESKSLSPVEHRAHRDRMGISSRGSDPGALFRRRPSRSSSCSQLMSASRSAPPSREKLGHTNISPLDLGSLPRSHQLTRTELSSRRGNGHKWCDEWPPRAETPHYDFGATDICSPMRTRGGEDISPPTSEKAHSSRKSTRMLQAGEDISPPREKQGSKRPTPARLMTRRVDCSAFRAGTPPVASKSSPSIPTMPPSELDSSRKPHRLHTRQAEIEHSIEEVRVQLEQRLPPPAQETKARESLAEEQPNPELPVANAAHDYWDEGEAETDPVPVNCVANTGLTCQMGVRGIMSLSFSKRQSSKELAASFMGTLSAPAAIHGNAGKSWVRGDVLGTGSLGRVFKALDQQTGEIFAVKEVHIDHKVESDIKFRQCLENELLICQELKHPHIVSYYGHDYIEGNLYIYLEYMPGGSLAQVLSQFGPLEEELLAIHARELLSGLTYLHTREPPVLHRDIKGANILVGLDCGVKLSDFGCSKRSAETFSQTMKGSIPWMAPEVITQAGYGRAADVWSFGCVGIEMATAKPPWGVFDNPVQAMYRIGLSEETPAIPDNLSPSCVDFLAKCVQRDKTLRPKAFDLLSHPFVVNAERREP